MEFVAIGKGYVMGPILWVPIYGYRPQNVEKIPKLSPSDQVGKCSCSAEHFFSDFFFIWRQFKKNYMGIANAGCVFAPEHILVISRYESVDAVANVVTKPFPHFNWSRLVRLAPSTRMRTHAGSPIGSCENKFTQPRFIVKPTLDEK